MADVNCHKILMKALDADEAGDKVNHRFISHPQRESHIEFQEKAIQFYTEAVE